MESQEIFRTRNNLILSHHSLCWDAIIGPSCQHIGNTVNTKQKQPSRGVLKKRFSGNIQQIYWRAPMLKCDFNKVAKLQIKLQ